MSASPPPFDWHDVLDRQVEEPVSSTRHRLRWVLAFFAAALAIVFGRAVQLEISDGENFRRLAAAPIERDVALPAGRGRIVARDGTPLAMDRPATALAVQFRYLESPSDPQWLRRMARLRLPRTDRRNADRLAAMEATVCVELADLHRRLAAACDLSDAEWQARAARIQQRVHVLAARVNQRRRDRDLERIEAESARNEPAVVAILSGLFAPPERLPSPEVILAEQTAYHRIVDDVGQPIIDAIRADAARYPGVKLVETTRRDYPQQSLAAHLVGHVAARSTIEPAVATAETNDEVVGLMGAERGFESWLRGRDGQETQTVDHRGKALHSARVRDPVPGHDLVLSIDPQLQAFAEQLLDRACRRIENRSAEIGKSPAGDETESGENTGAPRGATSHGGAIVVMDVQSGEIMAAGSAPRFDPNRFVAGDPGVEAVLRDPRRPLFDRVAKMAIPPGSAFKPFTALALLASDGFDPQARFGCQGYLDDPGRMRCQIFRQQGIGHGEVSLGDALAVSCNVYFFHHAEQLGAAALVDWTSRFGFARATGIALPDEAAGQAPSPDELRQSEALQAFAIGQGALTATPLQIVRAYAAIANGGRLVVPRITCDAVENQGPGRRTSNDSEPAQGTRVEGLTARRWKPFARGCAAWSMIPTARPTTRRDCRGPRSRARPARPRRAADRVTMPGLPDTCRPASRATHLSWCWNTPPTVARLPEPWPRISCSACSNEDILARRKPPKPRSRRAKGKDRGKINPAG